MKNLLPIIISSQLNFSDKIKILKRPPVYLAENTKDFNDKIDQIKYPLWKSLFFSPKKEKNSLLTIVYKIGISIKEKNQYLSEIKLHDSEGEINLYWADFEGFYDNVLMKELEKMKENRREIKIEHKLPEDFNFFGMDSEEFTEGIIDSYENFVLKKMHEETFGNLPFPSVKPNISLNRAREEQNLKDEDYLYNALILREQKSKINYLLNIEKEIFVRKIRNKVPEKKPVFNFDGLFVPQEA